MHNVFGITAAEAFKYMGIMDKVEAKNAATLSEGLHKINFSPIL